MFTFPQIYSTHDLNNAEIFLHQNQEMVSSNYLAANAQVLEYNQDFVGGVINQNPSQMSKTIPVISQTVRKDRHSKIFTSQGPRDRRVRLSIDIARKFFDLQEMLGYDKPSKTIDWLLTESNPAIKDLILQKKSQNGVNISSSPSECEVISSVNLESFENGSDSKRKSVFSSAKEMRMKARARARERTREKAIRKNGYDLSPSIPLHYMNNVGFSESILDCPKNYEAALNEDLIHESTFIRRKFKQYPSSIFGFHPNLIFSRDSSSNVTQNWDNSAISDQHN